MATSLSHQHSPSSSLFPVRIDVFSDDKTLRIVDTLLLDWTVWPLTSASSSSSLEDNAWYLAQSVLGDAEVMGMGRPASGRHFTGRVDLWSWEMLEKIQAFILPQLEAAQEAYNHRLLAGNRILSHSSYSSLENEKKRNKPETQPEQEERPAKRIKVEAEEGTTSALGGETTIEKDEGAVMQSKNETTRKNTEAQGLQHSENQESSDSNTEKATAALEKAVRSNEALIPIRIRMSVHGIRIHDDFLWDPSLTDVVTPLALAQSVGNDLSLAPEAVQAIAVNILEQIHGLELVPDEAPETDEGGPVGDRTRTTAAWPLDQKVHITNGRYKARSIFVNYTFRTTHSFAHSIYRNTVAHLVAQHRPTK